ncbi:aryl-alcohol dehydrogenase [Halomonas ventosae]|uniref:Aryl-alcohol dehydrogenase n=1 Tax=Halomonas ventosae TaxID=229007 RepID=A0A4R6ZGV3_9GAMM|nr:NAD(P)-dependent alcohol dehydrogenase [Halomonas ventosae]TDR51099.1 aryl-alcohol dehydrogenase [Halomonas ventosae]
MQIQAAVTPAQGSDFEWQAVELAEPALGEVRVRIVATGVCHTDAVARDLGIAPFPIVLGHEGAGVVEALGGGVTGLAVGDHVVLSFAHCGRCGHCLTGHPTVCDTFNELNFGGAMDDGGYRLARDGEALATFFGQSSFATHAVVSARNAVKVDPEVDLALLGPLGCGIQTGAGTVLNRLKPDFGTSLVVYGCGAVGLSAIMAASIAGCRHIIAVDVHDSRLALARELGATHALNGKHDDVVERIGEITGGGSEFAVETTGVPAVVRQSLQALRPLGVSAIVGVTPEVTLDVHQDLMAEGKSMIGVIEGDSVPRVFIPQLVAYHKAGRFPFDGMVTFYAPEQINQAFEDSKNGTTVKPVLRFD